MAYLERMLVVQAMLLMFTSTDVMERGGIHLCRGDSTAGES
jgi:hypothetical protein